jgi:hypothetical protein
MPLPESGQNSKKSPRLWLRGDDIWLSIDDDLYSTVDVAPFHADKPRIEPPGGPWFRPYHDLCEHGFFLLREVPSPGEKFDEKAILAAVRGVKNAKHLQPVDFVVSGRRFFGVEVVALDGPPPDEAIMKDKEVFARLDALSRRWGADGVKLLCFVPPP